MELEELLKDYSKEEGKWLIPEEEIPIRQEQIRQLRFRIQRTKESEAYHQAVLHADSAVMNKYGPLILRQGTRGPENTDGQQFMFTESDTFKHSKGNLECKACLRKVDNQTQPDIVWCPKFIHSLWTLGPNEYKRRIRNQNPNMALCYAGLLHSQFTVTEQEAKMVQKCDTCGFMMEDRRELAEKFDQSKFTVAADYSHGAKEDQMSITVTCSKCGEIMFEAGIAELREMGAVDANSELDETKLSTQYKIQMDAHYNAFHAGEV